MCFETFISPRYRTPQNEIVSDYLIGELVEKYPLKSVKSKVLCTRCLYTVPLKFNVHGYTALAVLTMLMTRS